MKEKSSFLKFIGDRAFITMCGMVILFMCISTLIYFAYYALSTGKSLEPVGLVITFLTGTVSGLIGYWWGSSSSSKDKDATISNLLQTNIETTTTTTTLAV